jgi:hypothetical protein
VLFRILNSMNSQNNWKAREINETAANITRCVFEAGLKIAAGSEAGTSFDRHKGYAAEVLLMNSELAMPTRDSLHAPALSPPNLLAFIAANWRPVSPPIYFYSMRIPNNI